MSEPATLDILIDIRARLDALDKTVNGIADVGKESAKANQETNKLSAAFRTGLGVDLVRRGMDMLVGTLRQAAVAMFDYANQTLNTSKALSMSAEAYQVMADLIDDTGGEVSALTQANNQQKQSLVEARDETSRAAAAFRTLGIEVETFRRLPLERKLEAIGFAIENATDKDAAYRAGAEILGSRTLPNLTNALQILATEGYEKVADAARQSGQVMDDYALQRAREAKQFWNDLIQSFITYSGETVAFFTLLGKSVGDSIGATLDSIVNGTFWDRLSEFYDKGKPKIKDLQAPEITPRTPLSQLRAWQQAQLELLQIQNDGALLQGDATRTEFQKRGDLLALLHREIEARQELLRIATDTPLADNETEIQRLALREKLWAEMEQARGAKGNLVFRQSAMKRRRDDPGWMNTENPVGNPNKLSMTEGVTAGLGDWVTDLGSRGEQVAASLQSSLGATVQGISDGIWGWLTGTQSFGDAMANLSATVFQTALQTIIQMGVQWLINAALIKMGMISIETTGDALRASRVVKENAAEAATLPAKTAGAAASGISSWGLALIFGAMAVAMILGLLGGFAEGGFTGSGAKHQPAGVVHRGEDVWSQADIARWGGVDNVEAMRVGGPAPVRPLAAGAALAGGALLAAASVQRKREKPVQNFFVDSRSVVDRLRDDANFKVVVQEMITSDPASFGIPS